MQRDRKEDQLCVHSCEHFVCTVCTLWSPKCITWELRREIRCCVLGEGNLGSRSVSACCMYFVWVCDTRLLQCVWRRFERWHRTSSAHSVQALLATTSNQQLVKYCACISHSEFINIDNRSPTLIISSKWSFSDMEFVKNDLAWLRCWAVVSLFLSYP